MKWLYSKEIHTYECEACNATFSTDVQVIVLDAYCPFCGDTGRESLDDTSSAISNDPWKGVDLDSDPIKTGSIKDERRRQTEDIMTERNCPDGGWWNPIQKRCEGEDSGNGFEFSEKDLTK